MRERLEFWLVVLVARALGALPRPLARAFANILTSLLYRLLGRLRRVGTRNLELALPALTAAEREGILRGVFRHLGWQLVEFCRMERYTPQNTQNWLRTEGLEHYLAARDKGKRLALKSIVMDRTLPVEDRFNATLKLAELPRNGAKVRVRLRCELTGRARGNYRKFKLCRIALRDLASAGQIPGMTKASW